MAVRRWITATQLRRSCSKLPRLRRAAERKLFSWESHAAGYPLTIAQHIYSRWSLAGFLSLQPAAVAGNKKSNDSFLPLEKSPPSRKSRSFRRKRIDLAMFRIGCFVTRWENSGTKLDARDFSLSRSETETVRLNFCLAHTLSFDLCPSVSLLLLPSPTWSHSRILPSLFLSLLPSPSCRVIAYYTIHVAYALLPSWPNYSASHCV